MTRLRNTLHSSQSFVGGLDLAKLAKERHLIGNISKCSLSDLCALILQKRLDKNTPLRTSETWENCVLTPEQISYAAKDAFVALKIYDELINHYDVPSVLPPTVSPLMPVVLLGSDMNTIVAEGRIPASSQGNTVDGVRVMKQHIVIEITRVGIPGVVISSHRNRSLNSFGNPPFILVCFRSHLRLHTPSMHRNVQAFITTTSNGSTRPSVSNFSIDDEVPDDQLGDLSEIVSLQESLSSDLSGPPENLENGYTVDIDGANTGAQMIQEIQPLGPMEWDYSVRSRVLKDVWHVFHMLYLPATHGLRKQFTRDLRDIVFVPYDEDRYRINSWGATQTIPKAYEELRNSSPEWTRARCRHTIPPPHILYPLVAKLFQTYGPLVDPTTKQPLFSASTWKVALNVLELIRKGFISDPPGISLYTRIGTDKKAGGLPLYRCARGTNATEGGVHTHIRSRLPKFGVSVRHVHASLLDFTLHHNLLVRSFDSFDK